MNKITLVNENKDILSNDKIAADKINTKMQQMKITIDNSR